ncbi:MAG: cytochrome c biogenesis protein CcsA [Azospirillaceae bacterium]|nr:cytochrome c biogenesis protein CcsA [Azospirillaceae bacterium]
MYNLLPSLAALAGLVPAVLVGLLMPAGRAPLRPDRRVWGALALGIAAPMLWTAIQVAGTWRTGLSTALWASIAACMALFTLLAGWRAPVWRLAPLFLPYMAVMAVLATITAESPDPRLGRVAPSFWIDSHIVVSVTTYGLLTLAAIAALAGFLQDRALKAKRPTALTRALPPVAESERLQVFLLTASEFVLGVGVLTGVTVLYFERGTLLRLDHKILLSSLAFVLIGCLLIAHRATGVGGRTVARLVLVAYLLITLAYPGVKFVTDIVLSRPVAFD